ncbi:uncharacterized protein LOC110447972 isoform X1 [Mizuhopecten yessoensis]|uniref:uncharacterized protein LOC110447972 isoform X1 n=1 Tax=Mizuhopecten yessoensis TaxID=6573 RepID=UPI000B4582CD|nr:uncharacterized protein LOC110447972 isoform X1 [Mizuhopecten yessoensis]
MEDEKKINVQGLFGRRVNSKQDKLGPGKVPGKHSSQGQSSLPLPDHDDFDVEMLCLAATTPRKRTVLSLETKLEIIQAVERKEKLKTEIAKAFGITGSTLTGIVKQKEQIMEATDSGTFSPARKRMRHGNFIAVEDALYSWVRKMEGTTINFRQAVSGAILRQKANEIANKLGVTGFVSSPGFIERFKKRKGIRVNGGDSPRMRTAGNRSGVGLSDNRNADLKRSGFTKDGHATSYFATAEGTTTMLEETDSQEDSNFHIEFVFHEADGAGYVQEASKSSTPMQYKQGQFQHRNKRDIDRRMPPSAARGSASETQTSGQNLTQPKPTSRPIPNQSCNKIPRDRSQFPTSGAIEGLNETETMDVTHDDHVSEKVVVKEEPEFEELGPEEALNRDLGTLERFREQQKEIEEANKHKKALLSKTLSERQKKARKEAEKLTHIQKELMILDNLLSADVTVVRNRIEFASRDYMEATRRYDKAEKEFIEAKLDLQKKSELKEQLTEHLYTIIHQNEIRKAKKLSDLMTELDMETKGEQLCIGKLPPLSAFSSMGIAKIASPTSPKSPTSDNVQAVKTDRGTTSEIPVSSSSDNLASTVNSSNSTSADQPRTETNLSNVVVDLSNENSTLNKENSCSPNSSSKDIHDTNSEQSESQGNTQNLAVENSDSIIGEEDLTLNDNTEQPSHSSSADDSSSYNSALSSNLGGDNSSESPKHAGIQDTEGTMPSSWTLDSVNIKEEPVT